MCQRLGEISFAKGFVSGGQTYRRACAEWLADHYQPEWPQLNLVLAFSARIVRWVAMPILPIWQPALAFALP